MQAFGSVPGYPDATTSSFHEAINDHGQALLTEGISRSYPVAAG